MKKCKYYVVAMMAVAAFTTIISSCAKDETAYPTPEPSKTGDMLIHWNISASDGAKATRAMIGSTAVENKRYFYYEFDENGNPVLNADRTDYEYKDNPMVEATNGNKYPEYAPVSKLADCISLEQACSPTTSHGLGHGIGFWVDYIWREGTTENVERNKFGDNTRLTYHYTGENPFSYWNYEGKAQYWAEKGRYLFRAFYPDFLKGFIERTSTNGELFVMNYNTLKYQEDLMVAHNEVFVADPQKNQPTIYYTPDGKFSDLTMVTNHVNGENIGDFHFSETFNLSQAVPLPFEHTQAAVRVRFTFNYEEEDELTSVFFRNTIEDKGMHTNGLLLYGAFEPFVPHQDAEGSTHKNTYRPEDDGFEPFLRLNNYKRTFKWSSEPHKLDDGDFYKWQVAETTVDGELPDSTESQADQTGRTTLFRTGIPFSYKVENDGTIVEHMAIAYSDSRDYAVRTTKSGETPVIIEKVHAENTTRMVWMGEYDYVKAAGATKTDAPRQSAERPEEELYFLNDNGEYEQVFQWTGYQEEDGVPVNNVEIPLYEIHEVPAQIHLEKSTTVMNDSADPVGQQPPTFASNEGWIFILPQTCDGTTELCFTTAETGDEGVTSLKIPEFTGTKHIIHDNGTESTYRYGDANIPAELGLTKDDFCDFAPGMRYTYTVVIGRTNLYLNLVVEPWRERHAVTEIVF